MTTYAPTLQNFSSLGSPNRAWSQDTRIISQAVENATVSDSLLRVLKQEAILQLLKTVLDASQDNWDGYNAASADVSGIPYAINFINDLSPDYPLPEISIDNDGEIAFDWDCGPRRIFSVRIRRDGSLNYAGLLGQSSFHGAEIMRSGIPYLITEGIDRVIRNRF